MADENAPESVMEFNEGDFEESARSAHARYGTASPASLNEMLENFGFEDQIRTMKRSIEMLLLKLADGVRILRFSEPSSGLSLEKRLEPDKSVAWQKKRWEKVFASMLERELGVTA